MRILLYSTCVSSADHAALDALLTRPDFPAARREMLQARRDPHVRATSVAATALLAQAIADWESEDFKNIPPLVEGDVFEMQGVLFRTLPVTALHRLPPTWETSESGKPFPTGIETAVGRAHVSLSHTDGVVLAAVSDRPVGVDGQRLSAPPARFPQLDARIRHADEAPSPTADAFIRRWAAKEAVVKVGGEGLSRAMSTLRVEGARVVADNGEVFWLRQGERDATAIAIAGRA